MDSREILHAVHVLPLDIAVYRQGALRADQRIKTDLSRTCPVLASDQRQEREAELKSFRSQARHLPPAGQIQPGQEGAPAARLCTGALPNRNGPNQPFPPGRFWAWLIRVTSLIPDRWSHSRMQQIYRGKQGQTLNLIHPWFKHGCPATPWSYLPGEMKTPDNPIIVATLTACAGN